MTVGTTTDFEALRRQYAALRLPLRSVHQPDDGRTVYLLPSQRGGTHRFECLLEVAEHLAELRRNDAHRSA